MAERQTPKGVVAVITGPDGSVWANAADFALNRPTGFTLAEIQEYRARRQARADLVRGSLAPALAKGMDDYLIDQLFQRLQGFRETFIKIGHDDG